MLGLQLQLGLKLSELALQRLHHAVLHELAQLARGRHHHIGHQLVLHGARAHGVLQRGECLVQVRAGFAHAREHERPAVAPQRVL